MGTPIFAECSHGKIGSAELARQVGMSQPSACKRINKFNEGKIDETALFAPPKPCDDVTRALFLRIKSAVPGITDNTVYHRIKKFLAGRWTEVDLFRCKYETANREHTGGNAEWLALSDKSRQERLTGIRGETPIERHYFQDREKRGKTDRNVETIERVVGCKNTTARSRFCRYRAGLCTWEHCLRPLENARGGRKK